jgi:hypothetical protein
MRAKLVSTALTVRAFSTNHSLSLLARLPQHHSRLVRHQLRPYQVRVRVVYLQKITAVFGPNLGYGTPATHVDYDLIVPRLDKLIESPKKLAKGLGRPANFL